MADRDRIISQCASALARLRGRLRADGGMTLIEVVVAALLVGLISLSLIGLEAVGRTTQDQRVRSQAVAVAQQDQERMRGMTADQLAKLNQTRTVTVEGTPFTVTSTATFISHSSGASSCSGSGAAADYAKVESSVTWANNKRTPVVERSIITPPAGGSLLAQIIDQNGAPLPGASVTVTGTDQSTDSTRRSAGTDTDGCAVFGGLLVGDYSVGAAKNGFVDADGNASPATPTTTTAGNTATTRFTMGQAGAVTATFQTQVGATILQNQQAPSVSWTNTGMATPGIFAPASPSSSITTPQTLFPFITTGTGIYNGNYSLWAGSCSTQQPPSNLGVATVAPGATGTSVITLPAMIVGVQYRPNTSTAYSSVKPANLRLTFPSPSGSSCGQTWAPPINTASGPAAPSTGWLRFPGQPYGSGYTVCADYRPSSTSFKATANVNNTSYASAGNSVTVQITGSSGNQGTC